MRKEYVKSMRLAGMLMMQGFKLYEVQKDKDNPNFDVYVFRGSDELTGAMMKIINGKIGGEKDGINNERSRSNSI